MITHPEVQRKAQAEIDMVVGSDRFPTFDDQVRLPYVDAVMKEVLRWRPIGPLGKFVVHQSHGTVHLLVIFKRLITNYPPGIPHVCTEDDYYKGYFIPKGSSVIANIW